MTLVQLKIFLELARTNSMGLCAQNLGVTKPNVSTSIANLEKELGVKLFFKSRSGSFLTPAGEQIYPNAKRMWQEYETIQEKVKVKAGSDDTLSILYPYAHSYFIQRLVDMVTESCSPNSILATSIAAPHLCEYCSTRNADFVGGMILKQDIDLLEPFKNDFLIYEINETPLGVVIETRYLPEGLNDVIADHDLMKMKCLIPVNPPTGNINSASVYDRYLVRHGLNGASDIVRCSSRAMFAHYIRRGYVIMFGRSECREYLADREEESKDDLCFLRIRPEETIIRYAMTRKDSPYFTEISDALAALFNRNAESFPHIKRL